MNLSRLKASLIKSLSEDEHCIDSLVQLLEEAPYEKMSFFGKLIFRALLKNSLNKRKQYQYFKKYNTQMLKSIHVERPIFVTGLPRSGTTLLQNLLINNFHIQGIPFWEIIQPIPQFQNKTIDNSFRRIKSRMMLYMAKRFGPDIFPMHPTTLNSYEECWHLFLITFHVYNFDFQLGISKYGEWISENSIGKAYEEYEEILRIIISTREDHRLILKCPEHMIYTDKIMSTFPNCTIIWIHRDPLKSILSYTNMIYEIHKFYFGAADKKMVAKFVSDRFYQMIKIAIQKRTESNINIIDVKYQDLIINKRKTLQYLSDNILDDSSKIHISKKNQNLNRLKSKIYYNSTQQGIDPNAIYHKFSDYMRQYDISKEI